MSETSIFVTQQLPPGGVELLSSSGHTAQMRGETWPIPRHELLTAVPGLGGLVCMLTDRVDADVLNAAGPGLRVVANMAVGMDNIDLVAARERGIRVTNTPGVLTDATADLAFSLLLSLARRIPEGDRMVREGRWRGWAPTLLLGADLVGQTLGIVGAGRIGTAMARRAAGFGMRVVHASRGEHPEVGPRLELEELLASSDFVSLHCPLTEATRHLIDADRIKLMKQTSYLINTARGPVVHEPALIEALRSGRIAGAAFDVFDGEPAVNPGLLDLPNVVLAPHVGSATFRTRERMARMVLEDAFAVLEGREPRYPVV